jgi:hypothetical protein
LNASAFRPLIIPRSEHSISRSAISSNALKVLYRLKEAGYQGFLVGGAVRDLLLGIKPKDFDVATNALPEEVRQVFRNSRLVGRRFRLAHVFFGHEIIEVATFRAAAAPEREDAEDADQDQDQDRGRFSRRRRICNAARTRNIAPSISAAGSCATISTAPSKRMCGAVIFRPTVFTTTSTISRFGISSMVSATSKSAA